LRAAEKTVLRDTIASGANGGSEAGRRERQTSQRDERTLEGIGSFSWSLIVIAEGS
jgi:hypothetical protein